MGSNEGHVTRPLEGTGRWEWNPTRSYLFFPSPGLFFISLSCYASSSFFPCCRRAPCFSASVENNIYPLHFSTCCLWASSLFYEKRVSHWSNVHLWTIRWNQKDVVIVPAKLLGAEPYNLDMQWGRKVGVNPRQNTDMWLLHSLTWAI